MRDSGSFIRIRNFQYASFQSTRPRSQSGRNPIKIVIDKIGADGTLQQQVVNQNDELQREVNIRNSSQVTTHAKQKQMTNHHQSVPTLMYHSTQRPENIRSHVFNRFHYDNYQQLPMQRAKKSLPAKRLNSNNKNIEVVFCESKFPEFVEKTNQKIQNIFKNEQSQAHESTRKFIAAHTKQKPMAQRKNPRTTLAACLNEFATLQKLSMFMELDQNLRQKCLYMGVEHDPSRSLMVDVLNHRFAFMKQLGRRLRERIYRCLFRRDDLNILSKINLQEYMSFCQMFMGRDASLIDTTAFIYLLLFSENATFSAGKAVIEQTNGPIHKQRAAIQTLHQFFGEKDVELATAIAKNESFMRLIIDLIVEK